MKTIILLSMLLLSSTVFAVQSELVCSEGISSGDDSHHSINIAQSHEINRRVRELESQNKTVEIVNIVSSIGGITTTIKNGVPGYALIDRICAVLKY